MRQAACVDFALHNIRCLDTLDLKNAEKVVGALCRNYQVKMKRLVRRIARSPHPEALLETAWDILKSQSPQRQIDFFHALFSLRPETIGYPAFSGAARFVREQAPPTVVIHFAEKHLSILRDEDHPFFECLDLSAYWLQRIRWFIQNKDFIRAWDEIKRSVYGLEIMRFDPKKFTLDDQLYAYQIRGKELAEALEELAQALQNTNILSVIPEEKLLLADPEIHRPGNIHEGYAAAVVARIFEIDGDPMSGVEAFPQRSTVRNRNRLAFARPGVVALGIGEYFRELSRERQRMKRARRREREMASV